MNQILSVTITDLARGGAGVAKLPSQEIVFVPFTAPGDEALIRIVEKNKNYSVGELVELTKPSSLRVKPPCPVFTQCGGCSWQHLPYSLQFETKKNGVLHALKRAGVGSAIPSEIPEIEPLPAKKIFEYRNRVQLRADASKNVIGFYQRGTNQIVGIDSCAIAHPKINALIPSIRQEAKNQKSPLSKVELFFNASKDAVDVFWNQKHAAGGFNQVHDEQNQVLQNWVKDCALHTNHEVSKQDRVLLDLFGGKGNLSLPLIQDFSEIHCVDLSAPKTPGPSSHYQFHSTSVLKWLSRINPEPWKQKQVTIILDPPREGLGSEFGEIMKTLSSLPLVAVILVGCDPDAFGRDVYRFLKQKLRLNKIAALDLFPQTPHIESLALLLP